MGGGSNTLGVNKPLFLFLKQSNTQRCAVQWQQSSSLYTPLCLHASLIPAEYNSKGTMVFKMDYLIIQFFLGGEGLSYKTCLCVYNLLTSQ